MTFGGGPLNNAVLQAMVPLVRRLRDEPAEMGLVTSVSGVLTKAGGSTWSATPPAGAFHGVDVSAEAAASTVAHALLPDATGHATVVAPTVVHDGGVPARAVAVLAVEGGRTVARSDDAEIVGSMTESDWVGRSVRVVSPGAFVAT
jgi:acetyl-CoA C-acetyltransferase